MTEPRPPLTLQGQADLIDYLLRRAMMSDGAPAKEAWMLLTTEDRADLEALRDRLRRMVPFENQIRKLVTAR